MNEELCRAFDIHQHFQSCINNKTETTSNTSRIPILKKIRGKEIFKNNKQNIEIKNKLFFD